MTKDKTRGARHRWEELGGRACGVARRRCWLGARRAGGRRAGGRRAGRDARQCASSSQSAGTSARSATPLERESSPLVPPKWHLFVYIDECDTVSHLDSDKEDLHEEDGLIARSVASVVVRYCSTVITIWLELGIEHRRVVPAQCGWLYEIRSSCFCRAGVGPTRPPNQAQRRFSELATAPPPQAIVYLFPMSEPRLLRRL